MTKPPTLFIASPGAGYNCTGAHFAISGAIGRAMRYWERAYGPDAKCGYLVTNRMSVDKARNMLAEEALYAGADWIFWIDDDMNPPPDVVERLMAHNAPIASGLCSKRTIPPEVMAYMFVGEFSHRVIRPLWTGVHKVDAVGMACVLMKRDVLQYVWDATKGNPFQYANGKYGTEDLYFFELAAAHGYQTTLDASIEVGHVGMHDFRPNPETTTTPAELPETSSSDYEAHVLALSCERKDSRRLS